MEAFSRAHLYAGLDDILGLLCREEGQASPGGGYDLATIRVIDPFVLNA